MMFSYCTWRCYSVL